MWSYSGPGWLMALAYIDPGNLEADLQMGAYTGYSLIWVLLWSTVLGLLLQLLAMRLGVVTGLNLAQSCRAFYPRMHVYVVWVLVELAIIGAALAPAAYYLVLLHNVALLSSCS